MAARLQYLSVLLLGAVAGALLGALALAPSSRPPARPPSVDRLGRLPPAPAPIAATPVTSAPPAPPDEFPGRAGETPPRTAERGVPEEAARDEPLVPTTARPRETFDDDFTLIPRGQGHFAILDLRPLHRSRLTIRAGRLERDGGANFGNFTHNRALGTLRGPRVRVELLHLGLDRDGVPTLAHIRTTGVHPVEGIVSLRRGDKVAAIRPDRGKVAPEEPF